MSDLNDGETLSLFAKFVASKMGLHFPAERLPELGQKMASIGREAGCDELDQYLLRLMSAPLSREQLDVLARTLTIGETYFLRDPRSYRVLEEVLLPELIAARRSTDKTLRIWSAGCSTGEEPYSIAILLSRAIPDLADWRVTLLASDINPLALERGRRGVYGQWSFRNSPDWLMDYFSRREDGSFEVVPRIRNMVRFSQLNLADEAGPAKAGGPGEFDVIFCRNVMLYFDAAQIEKTMARFHGALKDEGWLFVGPTEVDHSNFPGFCCRHYGGAFVLSKSAQQKESRQAAGTPWLDLPRQGRQSSAPAENAAGGFPVHPPPASAARPLAAPAPLGSALAEKSADRLQEPPGPGGQAQALDLYRAGSYQQAADLALSCLDHGQEQEKADALALAARAYANIGRFAQARECCEQAIACDRLSAKNHYLLSIILEQFEDTAGAVRSLKHALYIDHDYLLAYFALGNLSRRCGDRTESARNFAIALGLLEKRQPHEVLEETEGMTAGGLAQMIRGLESRSAYES